MSLSVGTPVVKIHLPLHEPPKPTSGRYGEMATLRHQGLVRDDRGRSLWAIRTTGSVQLEDATRSERLARSAIKGWVWSLTTHIINPSFKRNDSRTIHIIYSS
jgi:hypothetical protein